MDSKYKINKRDPRLRYALWKVHEFRDYYLGNELEFVNLEVDHIIPESLCKNTVKFKEYLKLMNLDDDFEVNSILNYVPTNRFINNRKSNGLLPPAIAALALNRAKRVAKKVIKYIELFDKDIEVNEIITNLKTNIKSEKEIEYVYDMITDDKDQFEDRKYIDKEDIFRPYQRSIRRIDLDGFLPSFRESEASCMFLFRTLSIRGCMMTLNNKQIINQLFKGIKTDPKYDLRGFISYHTKEDDYCIQLGNNKFILNREETLELCTIVDDFTSEYMESLMEVEEKLGTIRFKRSRKGAYKLIKINTELWKMILRFMSKNDAYNTSGEWSIFDPNEYMIKVYSQNHKRYQNGYHSIINLERDYDDIFDKYSIPNNDIWLVWKPHFKVHSLSELKNINESNNWNAKIAFKWLTEELIPKVIYENTVSSNIFGKPKLAYNDFLETFNIYSYISTDCVQIIEIDDIKNKLNLLEAINYLQSFFSVYESIFLKKENIANIYLALIEVLRSSKKFDIGYVTGNLGFTKTNDYKILIQDIERYTSKIEDSIVGNFSIDTTLRCILVTLRDFDCSLSENQISNICSLLEPLVEIYNRESLLNKQ